jgi:hypothetical protein
LAAAAQVEPPQLQRVRDLDGPLKLLTLRAAIDLPARGRSRVFAMPRLEDYSFGRIVVDGEEQTRDLIALPHRVFTNWWRREGHSLAIEDFSEVEDELPKKLILGTGAHGRLRPPRAVIEELERRGIDVEVLRTDDAVRRYGELEERHTAAALHLTC